MSFVVCVPSYNRPEGCRDMSLTTLKNGGIPTKDVYVFVANEEEKKKYMEIVPKDLYGHMIVGVKGLLPQRNFIGDYFPKGKHIVQLDDDVKGFFKVVPNKENKLKSKLEPIKNLENLFKIAFEECEKAKKHLWGIYPIANAGFMKDEIEDGLLFCPGWAWGVINRQIHLTLPADDGAFKEDYERTLQNAVLDGGVIRFSGVCAKTKMYSKGGLNATQDERLEPNKRNVKRLMERYPKLVFEKKMKDPKLQGSEIRLARKVPEGYKPSKNGSGKKFGLTQPGATPYGSGRKPDWNLPLPEFKEKFFSNLEGKPNKHLTEERKKAFLDMTPAERDKHISELLENLKKQHIEQKSLNKTEQKNLRLTDIRDKENTEVKYIEIRDKEKYNEAKDNLLQQLVLSKKKLPAVASRTKVIGKDTAKKAEGAKEAPRAETITFGFGNVQGKGAGFFKTNTQYPAIYKACVEFGNRCVPKGWEYNSITLNHNTKTKVHIDGYNVGRSVIVCIGDFTGGDIRVWERPPDSFFTEDGKEKKKANKSENQYLSEEALEKAGVKSKAFTIKDKPLMFNGGLLPHATEPFEGSGEKGKGRYTLVFYSHSKKPPNRDDEVNLYKNDTLGVGKGHTTGLEQPTDAPMC